jgi:hypothetical protein
MAVLGGRVSPGGMRGSRLATDCRASYRGFGGCRRVGSVCHGRQEVVRREAGGGALCGKTTDGFECRTALVCLSLVFDWGVDQSGRNEWNGGTRGQCPLVDGVSRGFCRVVRERQRDDLLLCQTGGARISGLCCPPVAPSGLGVVPVSADPPAAEAVARSLATR